VNANVAPLLVSIASVLIPPHIAYAVAGGKKADSTAQAVEESVTVLSSPAGFPLGWALGGIVALTLVAAALFYVWVRRQEQLNHDQKLKAWEIFFKMIGTIAVIAGGMIALGEYLQERERYLAESIRQHDTEIEQRNHELNMRLFEETSDVYGELLDLTSKIAFAKKPDEELPREFNQLYHGRLMMVESVEVARLAREWQVRMRSWQGSGQDEDLAILSLQLAAACRNHLQLFEVGKGMPAKAGQTEEVLAETQETFATAP